MYGQPIDNVRPPAEIRAQKPNHGPRKKNNWKEDKQPCSPETPEYGDNEEAKEGHMKCCREQGPRLFRQGTIAQIWQIEKVQLDPPAPITLHERKRRKHDRNTQANGGDHHYGPQEKVSSPDAQAKRKRKAFRQRIHADSHHHHKYRRQTSGNNPVFRPEYQADQEVDQKRRKQYKTPWNDKPHHFIFSMNFHYG